MVSPALAPRRSGCTLCQMVAAIEDVNVRLFSADGKRLRPMSAVEYVKAIGLSSDEKDVRRWVASHARHVAKFLESGQAPVPAGSGLAGEDALTRIEPLTEPERHNWLDVNQAGMDVGMEALRALRARLMAGELEPKEEVALARLGIQSANTRAYMSARGKTSDPLDRLMQIAAGISQNEGSGGQTDT